ncbi:MULTISPECIES: hypothetical protein [Streptomyces]|uniref:hypothetical protein n=1 Tax=Streptomyces TaxID=1883 RepID=UPI0004CD07FF|nr:MULTISPECIES: hypothetical protein [Streptomyces]KOT46938.1 hypothetical protein ADK43_40855 [Streptomyces rimosus subsp. rimosus]
MEMYADDGLSVWEAYADVSDARPAWAVRGGDGEWTDRWDTAAAADRFVLVDLVDAPAHDLGQEVADAARPAELTFPGGPDGAVMDRFGVVVCRGQELVDASLLGSGSRTLKRTCGSCWAGWRKWKDLMNLPLRRPGWVIFH